MKVIIRIFALLFLASCVEVTISVFSPCQRMTFSDALPVQFWLSDCDTYNETVPKGVHEACFCQPWQCDDEIKIQFRDDSSPELYYSLIVKDSNGGALADIAFENIGDLYTASLTPGDRDICDKDISLSIASAIDPLPLLAPSSWDDEDTPFDSKTATQFITEVTESTGEFGATMPLVLQPGEAVQIVIALSMTGTWTPATGTAPAPIQLDLRDANGNIVSNTDPIALPFNAPAGGTITLGAKAESAVLSLRVFQNVGSGAADVTISLTSMDKFVVLAKSDCLRIATTQDETELFEYSNGRNFAGLIYQDVSPDQTFFLRVPCRFFHEQFPEEDEAIELTSQVVTTSAQLKSQKLLEVQHVPYYFHKKLQLVLKHQSLTIGGKDYKKEEKYEINIGNKKWPLKSATCLLTEKSSVIRNVL